MCNNTNYGAFICYSPLSGYLLPSSTPPAAACPVAPRRGARHVGMGFLPSRGLRFKQVYEAGL